jgi:hypothetical protein
MPGDEKRSCQGLKAEMSQIQADIARLLPKSDKFGYNALCVAGGVLVIVPFFFMDLKDAEKTEIEALRRRYNHLSVIAAEKECDVSGVQARAENLFGGKHTSDTLIVEAPDSSREIVGYQTVKLPDGKVKLVPVYAGEQEKGSDQATEITPPEPSPRYSDNKEKCTRCGQTIPKLQKHFLVEGKIICESCYEKSKK